MKSGGTGIIGRFESGYKMNLKITCKTDCRETVTLGTVRLFLSTNKRDWKVSGKYWKVWTKGECVGLSRSERYTRSADWWVRSVRSVGSADSCGQTRSARLVRLDSSRLGKLFQAKCSPSSIFDYCKGFQKSCVLFYIQGYFQGVATRNLRLARRSVAFLLEQFQQNRLIGD